MNLAISNIAWPASAAAEAYSLLQAARFTGVEIAPGLLFPNEPDVRRPSREAVSAARGLAERHGLGFVSMQSLHFGVSDAALFGDVAMRGRFGEAIAGCIDLGAQLGLGNLVVGSPKNRIVPDGMTMEAAEASARELLLHLADRAAKARVTLAIEPNPREYGTNFLNTLAEATAFAEACDHPNIGVNFDTGAAHMTGEIADIEACFTRALPRLAHIHISKPMLASIVAEDAAWISRITSLTTQADYRRWISIEMRAAEAEPLAAVSAAAATLSAAAH